MTREELKAYLDANEARVEQVADRIASRMEVQDAQFREAIERLRGDVVKRTTTAEKEAETRESRIEQIADRMEARAEVREAEAGRMEERMESKMERILDAVERSAEENKRLRQDVRDDREALRREIDKGQETVLRDIGNVRQLVIGLIVGLVLTLLTALLSVATDVSFSNQTGTQPTVLTPSETSTPSPTDTGTVE